MNTDRPYLDAPNWQSAGDCERGEHVWDSQGVCQLCGITGPGPMDDPTADDLHEDGGQA